MQSEGMSWSMDVAFSISSINDVLPAPCLPPMMIKSPFCHPL